MMRVFSALGLATVLSVSLTGQTAPATFEIADVRPTPAVENGRTASSTAVRIGVPRNGRYEIRRATMVDLIRTAYGVDADKVIGGPHWLEMDRFDVIAKVPPTANADTVKPMLQALLAERFGLVVREGKTQVAAHVILRTGGELRLREGSSSASTCQQNLQTNTSAGAPSLTMTMTCRGVSLAAFGDQLSRSPSTTGVTGPLVDASGLTGRYDFDLQFVPSALAATMGGATFAQALAGVGLKLEPREVSLPTLTVERVSQTPTANDAAAVAAAFPPQPPLEFEVAVLKPSAPGSRANIRNLPTGQLNLSAVPLRTLIGIAWNPPNAASIVGPRTLDNTFDLIAKGEVGASALDSEVVGPMLQKLLLESLDLKVRWEERQVKGYSLVAEKNHKLTKADPSARTRCVTSSAVSSSSTGGVPTQTMTCQNMTMGEFAAQLQRIGGSTFQVPVLDETGLEGRWNFTISFALPGLAEALASARASAGLQAGAGGAGTASDPTGALSIEDAVERQMGLKLRARQRTGRVLVVDYVEDKP